MWSITRIRARQSPTTKCNIVIAAEAKKYALSHINEPAHKVVEPMIVKALDDNPNWNPINPTTLARAVNRVKAKRTAKNPTDFFFKSKWT